MSYPTEVIIDKNDRGDKVPLRVMQRLCRGGCTAVGDKGFDHLQVGDSQEIRLVFVHTRGKRHVVSATVKMVEVDVGVYNPRAFYPPHELPT